MLVNMIKQKILLSIAAVMLTLSLSAESYPRGLKPNSTYEAEVLASKKVPLRSRSPSYDRISKLTDKSYARAVTVAASIEKRMQDAKIFVTVTVPAKEEYDRGDKVYVVTVGKFNKGYAYLIPNEKENQETEQ